MSNSITRNSIQINRRKNQQQQQQQQEQKTKLESTDKTHTVQNKFQSLFIRSNNE